MHTIRLDVSNDIFDNVMFILNNLPKSDVKLKIEKNSEKNHGKYDSLVDFFQNSPLVDSVSFDRELEKYKSRIEF